jgi:hypothetical protein
MAALTVIMLSICLQLLSLSRAEKDARREMEAAASNLEDAKTRLKEAEKRSNAALEQIILISSRVEELSMIEKSIDFEACIKGETAKCEAQRDALIEEANYILKKERPSFAYYSASIPSAFNLEDSIIKDAAEYSSNYLPGAVFKGLAGLWEYAGKDYGLMDDGSALEQMAQLWGAEMRYGNLEPLMAMMDDGVSPEEAGEAFELYRRAQRYADAMSEFTHEVMPLGSSNDSAQRIKEVSRSIKLLEARLELLKALGGESGE